MEKGAAYIRVSTEDQTEYSPDAQLRAISQYAERNGIEIHHVFRDEGISGRRADKRPGFMRMVSMAKSQPKPFDIILVHKFDRFARNREDSIVYKSLLRNECKIKVVSVTEQMEDDKFSLILESMLEAMAEYYSLNLGEEVKKGMAEKAFRGELQTPAPFGYRMSNGLLKPEPNESRLVRQIFENYANGASLRSIAQDINTRGYKTIKGNNFDKRAIEYIICNPVYTGKIRWTSEGGAAKRHSQEAIIADGKHEAVIDEKLWKLANKRREVNKLKENINNYNRYDGKITTHWLRGLVKCAACGCTLAYCKGYKGRSSTYRCNKYLMGGCETSQRISVDVIEKLIINVVNSDTSSVFGIYARTNEINLDVISEIEKLLKKNASKLEKAHELAILGIDSPAEYAASKSLLIKEQQRLRETLDENKSAISSYEIKSLYDILTSTSISADEKNGILREMIKKIVYDKNNGRIEVHYYYIT